MQEIRWISICLKIQGSAPDVGAKLYLSAESTTQAAANERLSIVRGRR